jgi:hypothetical protein
MREVGEVVLIYYQDQPTVFGRIESIEPDIKKDWYQVSLLLLTIPTQAVKWILRESYVDGDTFTMGGRPMKLETVPKASMSHEAGKTDQVREEKTPRQPGNVIPFKKPE